VAFLSRTGAHGLKPYEHVACNLCPNEVKPMGPEASGESLDEMVRRERSAGLRPRSLVDAVSLLQPIVDTIRSLHARGLSHGDLRPGTIWMLGDPGGQAIVSRLPGRADRAGPADAAYRAPEQFSEAYGIVGPWTDVFALALILVTLVSDEEPVAHPDFAAIASRPRAHQVPPARIPEIVDGVLVRALSVYPAERWQTVGSFWAALEAALAARWMAA
jgi:serine/threonine protein kinase